jgi:hypothetical protein
VAYEETTTQPAGDVRSQDQATGELVKQLSEQVSTLARQEIELAKAELTEKGKQAGVGAGMFGTAGIVGYTAFLLITAAAVLLLDTAMAAWVAALIVGAIYAGVAAFAAITGRDRLREAGPPIPEQAVESVKEDTQWVKDQAKYARR